jgi:hypothetical protein
MPTRFVVAAACAALGVGVAVPGAGARTSVSSSYAVSGVEASVPTNNTSTFAGAARGSGGDAAFWRASVAHQALSSCPFGSGASCAITGGTFTLATVDGSQLAGTFATGTVTPIAQATPCRKQTFAVSATLGTTSGGATLTATLTHYRLSLFGTCITYFATIRGSLALGSLG